MKCPRCEHDNPRQAKFCLECAAPLALRCTNCGTQLPAGAKFCFECATPVGAPGSAPKFSSPENYTPKHLAERIINSKAALEGERKQVTVLFADLKGSMELLADRDPEEARKLLDPVLELMMEAVHHYEGTVNQVMGDGIMALFGAPVALEDHAVRACYAALRMQGAVGRYGDELQRTSGLPVQIRVGLNSGEVVVRSIGSDLRMDYTAVGQTTHLAARMEQAAPPGRVLIAPETLRLAEAFIRVKPVGPLAVKGLEAPVAVHELTSAESLRSRMEATAARGATSFVGRQREMEVLLQAMRQARAGHGQVVALVGEPGVGKSRLLWEFIHSPHMEGGLVLEGTSASYGKTTPYLPVRELLRPYFQIDERDDAETIREKLTGKLVSLDPTLILSVSAFLSLVDLPVDDLRWQALDPPSRQQEILEALKRVVLRESQVQPLCLALEDLHWIDSETQRFLDNLVESLPAARVLLIVNYRPEYQHTWANKTYYTQLRIDPLPPERAEELLELLLGNDAGLASLKQRLITQTNGNPFFLGETVRTLVETHVLKGERGAYRLQAPHSSIQVPATVQAVLAARIDRLPPEEKRLLQAAAVIGEQFAFTVLQAIADEPEGDLRRGLAHLQAAEFLYEARLFPDLEYTFKHGLTYQVAYGSLLHERRRALHSRIVKAIEDLYVDRLTEQIERLAHHALRGELWEPAARYFRQAGTKAFDRSANREAVASLEQALVALTHLPAERSGVEAAIDIRLVLRSALLQLGEIERITKCLKEAESLALAASDRRRLAWVWTYTSICHLFAGEPGQAAMVGERACRLAEEVGDAALRASARTPWAHALRECGEYRRAVGLLGQTIEALRGDLVRQRLGQGMPPSLYARSMTAVCLADLGEFAEGMRLAEEAAELARTLELPFGLVLAHIAIGHTGLMRGRLEEAAEALQRALDVIETRSIPTWFPWAAAALGYTRVLSGRVADGMSLLEQGLERAVALPFLFGHSQWVAWLAHARVMDGDVAEAGRAGAEALRLSRTRGERGYEAWALYILGEIAAPEGQDAPAPAEAHYQALALATELGMRPLVAHCHLGLGKLHRRTGEREQAQEHLATATTMYREMGMTYWLEQAGAELK